MVDVVVIGAGVVGCAIARELSKYRLSALVLEKEGDVAEGISKANSGVIHAGFNVRSGSRKALLNIEGAADFPGICEELGVPYQKVGKLVVAKDESELPYLKRLLEQGRENGCSGLSIIGKDGIRGIEPLVRGEYALRSENTAVVSPYLLTIAFAESAFRNGVPFRFYSQVVAIEKADAHFLLRLKDGETLRSRIVINSAGMYSDQILSLLEEHGHSIHPYRGEYYIMDKAASDLIRSAVYPVPPTDGRGLGIHLTPTIEGTLLIGPSAERVDCRNDVANTKEVMETLKREAFDLIPELRSIPLIKSYSGLRPKLFEAGSGSVFEDFVIEASASNPGFISLIGIESPGLTSAGAIARYVVRELVSERMDLQSKDDFEPRLHEDEGNPNGIPRASRRPLLDGDGGCEIFCRCNAISKAEILRAVDNPLGVKTINGIKKRTHAMMGRCQGGFCLPRIVRMLDTEYGIEPCDIVKNAEDSRVLLGRDD
jgi:glycerol-3-phosphate dehydrogenase